MVEQLSQQMLEVKEVGEQQTRMKDVVALGPTPLDHRYRWNCKETLEQEGVPKAHYKQGAQHRCQEYQTQGALLVGEAGKDSQKGDNKARETQKHSEDRDQVALAPQTLGDQQAALEVAVAADWEPHAHLWVEAA